MLGTFLPAECTVVHLYVWVWGEKKSDLVLNLIKQHQVFSFLFN